MRRVYHKDAPLMAFAAASTQFTVLAVVTLFLSGIIWFLKVATSKLPSSPLITADVIKTATHCIMLFSLALLAIGVLSIIIAVIAHYVTPDESEICRLVRRALCCSAFGNPLHLRDGDLLPSITCVSATPGVYELTVSATSCTVEDIQAAATSVSSALNKRKYRQYAVTQIHADLAFNDVTFVLEDVTLDRALIIHSVNELRPTTPTKLMVQQGTSIDLTTSGSMLVAGKTRSGKTTGIIALLFQVLLSGRDAFGSEIVIIDPKMAELSRVSHVVTLTEDSEATEILSAIQRFADSITQRQKVLNELSEKYGDAVHWWDAGFHVSLLFIDEYVALRSILPVKPSKDAPDYCVAVFDALLKRILTMGASAGCFAIVSIAEASVQEGGLPAMLRSAMSTRILFRPTMPEARLMWDASKLEALNDKRVFTAGDAWFSSTDGITDNIVYVHFPHMKFEVYAELNRLLQAYYAADAPPSEAEAEQLAN